jgi:transposase InsO family protein
VLNRCLWPLGRMTEALEPPFGLVGCPPHRIEWLSDNGPAHIATGTKAFATIARLIAYRSRVESPDSNGMVEARWFSNGYPSPLKTITERIPMGDRK